LEECRRHPVHKVDGHDCQQCDVCGKENRAAHLCRGGQDDVFRRAESTFLAILAQTSHDIFNIDNRVVDDDTQRDHSSCQNHGVQRCASKGEDKKGSKQGNHNCDQADESRAPTVKESAKH
jgi:hypothetical protein